MEHGYVLVDVRPKDVYEKAHPEGAKNAALFRKFDMGNTSFSGLLRATALALNGVTPVEPNPFFVADLVAAAGKGSKIILACEAGGSLVPNASFQYGKESRSLKAAYKAVVSENFADVLHLGGGAYGWYKADLPFVGEYDLDNVGRTPNVVSDD
ncbi:probable rhodanese-like domain-containing protein 14, chloroplastic [Coccomyxa sp. Obi]|nr:probable rhodanese-like domain-containing protein 14, chloroplastic [Coccomyxa sp. Obi]